MRRGELYSMSPKKVGLPRKEKNKDRLILIIGKYDFSGIGYHLSRAITRYIKGWRSRCIIDIEHGFRWPHDILARKETKGLIKQLMSEAELILFSSSDYFHTPLDLPLPAEIPWSIWHGGTHFRAAHEKIIKDIHPYYDFIFSHRDLEGFDPNIIRLQAPFDTLNYRPPKRDWNGKIIIGHTPTNHRKGTEFFEKSSEILKKKYGDAIGFDLIKGLSFSQVMERRKDHHIFFEKIRTIPVHPKSTHGYGTSTVEAASLGSVCLCGLEDHFSDTPIDRVWSVKDIVDRVSYYMDNRGEMEAKGQVMRQWVHKEHGYRAMAHYFMKKINRNDYLNKRKEHIERYKRKLSLEGRAISPPLKTR